MGPADTSYIIPNDLAALSAASQIPFVGYNSSPAANSGTGIKIRHRNSQQAPDQNTVAHGTAPRRLRLQKKLQLGPVQCRLPSESLSSEIIHEGKLEV